MSRGSQFWVGVLLLGIVSGCAPSPPDEESRAENRTAAASPDDPRASETILTSPPPATPEQSVHPRETLRQSIHRAAAYLVRACGEDGRFVYEAHLDPSVTVEPKYNILRHAGAIYALGMYHQDHPGAATRAAMLRAGEFLRREAIAPVPGKDDLLAVWSDPRFNHTGAPRQAKLGATGLGLVALLSIERVEPGFTSRDDLRRLGRFVLWMQKEDGSFYSKYFPGGAGRDDSWTSLYYPGEAALGLLMLHEHDPSPKWQQAAAGAIAYLARMRRARREVEADHWALLATATLLDLDDKHQIGIDREAAVAHAVQVCRSILDARPRYALSPATAGCLTHDGRTCPTATRVEGLVAALAFLPPEQAALRDRIASAATEAAAFLRRVQIQQPPYSGGIPAAAGGSRAGSRAGEIRVDYVQHALSAMIQIDRLSENGPQG